MASPGEDAQEDGLQPAVRPAGDGADTEGGPTASSEQDTGDAGDADGNVAGMLERDQPLEPQEIDLENAIFVTVGVLIVVVFLILAIQGL